MPGGNLQIDTHSSTHNDTIEDRIYEYISEMNSCRVTRFLAKRNLPIVNQTPWES